MVESGLVSVKFATITAARLDYERLRYSGAVYDRSGLVEQSIRPPLAWNFGELDGPTTHEPIHLKSATYLGRFFFHFGHFLIETLPNFAFAGDASPIIMHPWPETLNRANLNVSYIKLSLEALGVKHERIIFADRLIRVDDLLVAPRNEVMANKPSPHTIPIFRKIAAYVRQHSVVDTPSRIYFSRRNFSGKRRTHDEGWLEDIFHSLGFAIIFPETLPFEQQVELAAGAKFVAGIDGSALHLCGFMETSGRCLVISTRTRHRMIATINAMAGVDTDWIDGAGVFDNEIQAVRLNRDIIERGVRKWVEEVTSTGGKLRE